MLRPFANLEARFPLSLRTVTVELQVVMSGANCVVYAPEPCPIPSRSLSLPRRRWSPPLWYAAVFR